MFGKTLLNALIIITCALIVSSQVTGVVVARSGVVVKNAPYSADTTSISVQTLYDGNKITSKNATKVYRDSEGRTRTEQILSENDMKTTYYLQRETITIEDPVAGFSYYLNPNTKTARKVELKPYESSTQPMTAEQREYLSKAYATLRSDLPEKTIEGLVCRGSLTKTTTAAGLIGNERELVMTTESWYSSDLKITVLMKTTDPRFGDRTLEFKNISRNEPEKSLFTIPKDYKIIGISTVKD